MTAFNKHAMAMHKLTAQVPFVEEGRKMKNYQARFSFPAKIVRPTEIFHIQQCVRWAIHHKVSLTVIGGGHSEQCVFSHVVAIDMSDFDKIHIVTDGKACLGTTRTTRPLIVVEAGCKSGTVVRRCMDAGLAVPLGDRPSIGAGLWLQGGIGHLSRLHGLSCDAIVGAVMVGLGCGEIFYVGQVPEAYLPKHAKVPDSADDLLWAIKGAGTNFGIIVSVTFQAFTDSRHMLWSFLTPFSNALETRQTATWLSTHCNRASSVRSHSQ